MLKKTAKRLKKSMKSFRNLFSRRPRTVSKQVYDPEAIAKYEQQCKTWEGAHDQNIYNYRLGLTSGISYDTMGGKNFTRRSRK